ncbi:hypothetical protein H4582DRAFT_2064042 [Lactarius indigo]|nr:hypothetical protein H4582DRAFT_2064042 [Lactarius indigo]
MTFWAKKITLNEARIDLPPNLKPFDRLPTSKRARNSHGVPEVHVAVNIASPGSTAGASVTSVTSETHPATPSRQRPTSMPNPATPTPIDLPVRLLLELMDIHDPSPTFDYVDMESELVDFGMSTVMEVYEMHQVLLETVGGLGKEGARSLHAYVKKWLLPLMRPNGEGHGVTVGDRQEVAVEDKVEDVEVVEVVGPSRVPRDRKGKGRMLKEESHEAIFVWSSDEEGEQERQGPSPMNAPPTTSLHSYHGFTTQACRYCQQCQARTGVHPAGLEVALRHVRIWVAEHALVFETGSFDGLVRRVVLHLERIHARSSKKELGLFIRAARDCEVGCNRANLKVPPRIKIVGENWRGHSEADVERTVLSRRRWRSLSEYPVMLAAHVDKRKWIRNADSQEPTSWSRMASDILLGRGLAMVTKSGHRKSQVKMVARGDLAAAWRMPSRAVGVGFSMSSRLCSGSFKHLDEHVGTNDEMRRRGRYETKGSIRDNEITTNGAGDDGGYALPRQTAAWSRCSIGEAMTKGIIDKIEIWRRDEAGRLRGQSNTRREDARPVFEWLGADLRGIGVVVVYLQCEERVIEMLRRERRRECEDGRAMAKRGDRQQCVCW